jgi:hypothetical protein
MLGWGINIYRTNLRDTPDHWRVREVFVEECELASWDVGLGGIDWLEELVRLDKATLLGRNSGYPVSYQSTAGVILPIIAAGVPRGTNPPVIGDEYAMPESWRGEVTIKPKILSRCRSDSLLLIHAWDLS